ncbi:MAG: hypothetical protein AAF849_08410 [Bacteroidota bacterium]
MKQLFLFIALSLLFACECEELTPTLPEEIPDPFQVVGEAPALDFDGDFIAIRYTLNKLIDPESVALDESVLIEGISEPFVQSDLFEIAILGNVINCDFSDGFCSGSVSVTFKGTGNNSIQSTAGQILDGDFDNEDGGDFVETINF